LSGSRLEADLPTALRQSRRRAEAKQKQGKSKAKAKPVQDSQTTAKV